MGDTFIHQCANEGCKKKVPNCGICLKTMDMLNPYIELRRQQKKEAMSSMPKMMSQGTFPNFGNMTSFNLGTNFGLSTPNF